jgi:osmotically inducible protein OsmC
MSKVLYTAHAHVTGGREGHARTADGELEVDLRTPRAMGGTAGGTNPEELFAVGYAACFGSTLGVLARRHRQDAGEVAIDSTMCLLAAADGAFTLAATLDVALPSISDRETATQLVRQAHQVCPYSIATRGNIDVEILLDGNPVSSTRREPVGTTED